MRSVRKNLMNIPPSLNYSSIVDFPLIVAGNKGLIKDKIYKGTYKNSEGIQSEVRDYLNRYYYGKCAYCEMDCKAEIEHYRPKLKVEDEASHAGYYWLCYEWSNLLPSCRYCNTEGAKGNKFPIQGRRVWKPNTRRGVLVYSKCSCNDLPLLNEKPLLLNPEIDKPTNFFEFELARTKIGLAIRIIGKGSSGRGDETISICKLNRKTVRSSRTESVLYPMKQQITLVFNLAADGLLAKTKIPKALKTVFVQFDVDARNKKGTHTLLRSFLLKNGSNFENCFSPMIEEPHQRQIVVEAFYKYKAGTL